MNSKKKLLAATVAFFVGGAGQGVVAQDDGEGLDWLLEEVVVTATKRGAGQSIQDTALSITALSKDTIENRGLTEIRDYANTLPGVSMADAGVGVQRVYIRGLAITADQQAVTNTYLGEIPLSTVSVGVVDLKLVDIERIEVLKGPQGSLYGSGSLAGTLRYIPVAPNLEGVEGSIKADFASFSESDDISQSYTAVFNAPLINNQLALRVAAYHFDDAGYVDAVATPDIEALSAATGNPVRLEDDINSITTTGARATLLWQVNDKADITLTLGTQEQESDGLSAVNFELGGYKVASLNTGPSKRVSDADYANLVVEYDLGWAALTSSTSAVEVHGETHFNFSAQFPTNLTFGALHLTQIHDTDIFSQEIRLASQLEGSLQFVGGLFYEDIQRNTPVNTQQWIGDEAAMPVSLQSAPVPGLRLSNTSEIDYQQQAIFGEVSYDFDQFWQLTLGARAFDYDRTDIRIQSELDASGAVTSDVDAGKKDQIYKANLSFTPNDDTLIYAQFSEGFRLGRGQVVPDSDTCDVDGDGRLDDSGGLLTDQLDPDTTENFELGAKFTLLDNRLTLNGAIYRIDWQGIPALFRGTTDACGFFNSINNNAGSARSEGVELEVNYFLASDFKVDLALAYNEAYYTDTSPNSRIEIGEDLPFAPNFTANMGVEYSFDIGSNPAFIRSDFNYFGEAESNTQAVGGAREPIGGYLNVNLRASVSIDQWEVAFYGRNLTNENNFIRYDFTNFATLLPPRKLGLEIKYTF